MTITSRIRRILAAGAATVAVMAVGLPAAQADASVGSFYATSLKIAPSCAACGVQSVKVEGSVTMPPSEAQSLIDRHYNVVIRLWGEDGFSETCCWARTARTSSLRPSRSPGGCTSSPRNWSATAC